MMSGSALKVLHVFDHSVPLMSGYSMRSLALLGGAASDGLGNGPPHHAQALYGGPDL